MEGIFYWVYILQCENQSYYTGYTDNLVKRYRAHVEGTARCKYTRSFKPIAIAQCWKVGGNKAFAMQLERGIKKLSKMEKEKIISRPSRLSKDKRVQRVTKKVRLRLTEDARTLSNFPPLAAGE